MQVVGRPEESFAALMFDNVIADGGDGYAPGPLGEAHAAERLALEMLLSEATPAGGPVPALPCGCFRAALRSS